MNLHTHKLFLGFISSLFALTFSSQMLAQPGPAEPTPFGFFVTSVGVGDGANLGGLEGADAHCQELAADVGAGDREWRAFLSAQAVGDTPAVNAIDRIGEGPWGNVNGVEIAANVEGLIYDNSNLNYEYSLNEKGEHVNSRAFGHDPNMHDVLTGTTLQGLAPPPGDDLTCSNWTSNDEGRALVGHHDRHRGVNPGSSWSSAHPSRGCSQEALQGSGGAGLFYCFAAD